jgi:hypothetical protein
MKLIPKSKIIITAAFLFFAPSVFAAETSFDVKNSSIQTGTKFEAKFFLNTDNENINAVEGKIVFPEKLLELKEIKDGDSIVNFWIDRPEAKNGEIIFSGITPGGYSGDKGLIFSLVFQSIREGLDSIEIQDIKTLLNDGKGTEANTTISNLQFAISKQASTSQPAAVEEKDTDMPEAFEPTVTSDPAIFDGKNFLVFVTQDKGSGINRYEIKETRQIFFEIFSKWISAKSPYVLRDQKLQSWIFVKAIDKVGNERVAELAPQKKLAWYEDYLIWVIIIVAILISAAYLKRRFYGREN